MTTSARAELGILGNIHKGLALEVVIFNQQIGWQKLQEQRVRDCKVAL
jgi:hypothetical protein